MNKVCFGCGIKLQCENELSPGYIPENKYENSSYCKRCFRLTHYGEINNIEIEKSTKIIIDKVNNSRIFKIYILDFLNINNNTINIFNKIKGDKMLLISKIDLLDKSININRIIKRIKEIYNINYDIRYISSKNNYGIESLIKYLEIKKIKKSYILGPTNSGKSTLLNNLINKYNPKINKLTISNKRNTTLEYINIKLNNITFIDSPGFLINDYNLKTKYKETIKPITYNMKKEEILYIDKFYIKFTKPTSITIYTSELIDTKKYYKEIDFDYEIDIVDNIDLCINGFGVINIKKSNLLSINNLDKNLISIRSSVFGGHDE